MLNPLVASDRIREEYRRYLLSTFPLRRDDLRQELDAQLGGQFALSKGPYLQVSPPFVTGASVRALVDEDVLSRLWLDLPASAFPIDRPLYVHQEQAIRKAKTDRRNLVVTTGTGSGKTECFLIPIIDDLLREVENGSIARPGVRALLLYPMNALANDQLKRLRTLLAHLPKITFGRYVGDTQADADRAEADFQQRYPHEPRLDNELISREAMQAAPPRILLTNYAMLEYLLLRPADSALFDGRTAGRWRHLVLDEVHVYDGTQGAEVAMLLRRLRDRVNGSQRGALQCFGTSATLGGGQHDYPKLVRYAEDLFDEPFAWNDDDPSQQDVVGAQHKPLVRGAGSWRLDPQAWRRIRAAYRDGASADDLHLASGDGVAEPTAGQTPEAWLADLLTEDEQVIALQRRLERGATTLRQAAQDIIGSSHDAEQTLVDLVDLGVAARHGADDAAVIPARYHFFLRALEGAFVCLHPSHDDGPRLLLSRHEQCPSCAAHGRRARMIELGSCRRCGAEYAIGVLSGLGNGAFQLEPSRPSEITGARLLLGEPLADDADDEDEATFGEDAGDRAVPGLLCPGCGLVTEGAQAKECGCSDPPRPVRVAIARSKHGQSGIRRCLACARRSSGDIVGRFMTGSDAPVAVIATDLYQEIPASTDESSAHAVGRGRKLLTFSDSRQDAAFFAPYLERTYNRAVQRRLIQINVQRHGEDEPCLEDLLRPIRRQAEDEFVLDPDATKSSRDRRVSEWLLRELLAVDRRQTLEGTAMAEVRLRLPARWQVPAALMAYGLDAQQAEDLVRLMIDTVRLQGAVNAPEGVDLRDEVFAPRNLEISIRERGSDSGMLAWMPGKGINGRLDLIRRIFARKGIEASPAELLHKIWQMLTHRDGGWDKVLVPVNDPRHGPAFRLDPNRFSFIPAGAERLPGRCGTCRQLWWRSVAGVCPTFQCAGTVHEIEDVDELKQNHYARLYSSLEPIGLSVQEHTAQWVSSEASAIQDKFVRGRINVLSCSTTFELGVDVGEVQAVLLRNVPPSPANYVQRAGRAGRRTDSAALVVCFAQRRSHDLHYFDAPTRMVDGIIPPPQVPLTNVPIVRRHVHSVAFAAYQRETSAFKDVAAFFVDAAGGDTYDRLFVSWLQARPAQLFDALRRIVPPDLHEPLDLDGWSWVDALIEPTEEQPTFGWLKRAGQEIRIDAESLSELEQAAAAEGNYRSAGHLKLVRATMLKRYLLNFLASRNILPKYGFPVDVVELSLAKSGDPVAGKLELSRDLTMAIRDYAPGAQVVAGKALWSSDGLALRRGQTWPTYHWVVCDACGAFRQGLEAVPTTCPSCQSDAATTGGRFIIPIHGFVGSKAAAGPGESQPRKPGFLETYFGSYGGDTPELEVVPELSAEGRAVQVRFSHQGQITVLNRGSTNGFHVCEWCGFAAQAAGRRRSKEHKNPQRPGVGCTGPMSFVQLGHIYLTDVVELRFDEYMEADVATSALHALVAAMPDLGIKRDDIDGTLDWYAQGRPAFILFDAVPGGAGHAQEVSKRLPELFRAALAKVSECECGQETACYSCLLSYSNQRDHEHLSRGSAIRVLASVLKRGATTNA